MVNGDYYRGLMGIRRMDKYKWMGRYILCGLALVLWWITKQVTGEMPPEFLTGLVGTAWGVLFVSREKEKANAQKAV